MSSVKKICEIKNIIIILLLSYGKKRAVAMTQLMRELETGVKVGVKVKWWIKVGTWAAVISQLII